MVWINALVASGGGRDRRGSRARAPTPPRRSRRPAGDKAAEIVGELARSSAAPADCRPPGRRRRASLFQGDDGVVHGQLALRLPSAAQDAVQAGALDQSVVDDIGWARYPRGRGRHAQPAAARRHQPRRSAPSRKHPDEALARGEVHHVAREQHRVHARVGQPGRRGRPVRRPEVREAFPMADLIRESINDAGAAARHAVLRRRLGVGAADVASAGGRRRSETPRRPTTTWRRCSGRAAAVTAPTITAAATTGDAMTTVESRTEPPRTPAEDAKPRLTSGPATNAGSAVSCRRRRSS